MYDSYSINPYKLRKLAALRVLCKLAEAPDVLWEQDQYTPLKGKINSLGKKNSRTQPKMSNPAQKAYKEDSHQTRLAKRQLSEMSPMDAERMAHGNTIFALDAERQAHQQTRNTLTKRLIKARKARAQQKAEARKYKGRARLSYGIGGGIGAAGGLSAILSELNARKSRRAMENALAELGTSRRGLSAAQARIKQLEGRGFFDYLFGRNK